MGKKELRDSLLKKRRLLSAQSVNKNSALIVEKLLNWPIYHQADNIMVYLAMPGEPNIDEFIRQALIQGKNIFVPFLTKQYGIMEAVLLSSLNDVVVGKFGIRSASFDKLKLVDPGDFQLVIVPGIAFDASGNRLGMGAGYYDRFLLQAPAAVLAGVCWNFCKLPYVPTDSHDQRVHYVVTEEAFIKM